MDGLHKIRGISPTEDSGGKGLQLRVAIENFLKKKIFMKIKINSNFGLPNDCRIELEMENGMTVRDLLLDIGKKLNFNFFDSESENVYRDLQIKINGKDFLLIATQLETILENGDSVDIYVLPLGGG